MCGRMSLTRRSYADVAEEVGVPPDSAVAEKYIPRFNIAPTQQHWIVSVAGEHDPRRMAPALWGMGPNKLINAKGEAIRQFKMWRHALQDGRRCIVPVDGFYEWTGDKKDRRPIRFHSGDGGI